MKKKTAAMKGVAVGTLTFLPATFVSVSALAEISPLKTPSLITSVESVFGTSFFNYQPANGGGEESFTMSNRFWVYWVLAAPLSIITLLIWVFWEERITKRHHKRSTSV